MQLYSNSCMVFIYASRSSYTRTHAVLSYDYIGTMQYDFYTCAREESSRALVFWVSATSIGVGGAVHGYRL